MTEYGLEPVPCDKCGAPTPVWLRPELTVVKRGIALCAEHSGRVYGGTPGALLDGWHWVTTAKGAGAKR